MLCLRCSRGLSAIYSPSLLARTVQNAAAKTSARTFTSLRGPSRPSIFPSSTFRPALLSNDPAGMVGAIDLLPNISTHPAMATTQIRCAPRNTYNPSHFVRKRRHGFLSRLKTRKGRMTLARRRAKGRRFLSH